MIDAELRELDATRVDPRRSQELREQIMRLQFEQRRFEATIRAAEDGKLQGYVGPHEDIDVIAARCLHAREQSAEVMSTYQNLCLVADQVFNSLGR